MEIEIDIKHVYHLKLVNGVISPSGWFGWFMVFDTTFNNIFSYIVAETTVPGENHRPVASN